MQGEGRAVHEQTVALENRARIMLREISPSAVRE
jgi:hypothetical protein